MNGILITTRNRIDAVIECLKSVMRINDQYKDANKIVVVVQDNSDEELPLEIIRYFQRHLRFEYIKTSRVLPMAENWDQGIARCIELGVDIVSILADRRLASENLLNAFILMRNSKAPFLVFDHQRTWLNSRLIVAPKYSYQVSKANTQQARERFLSCDFDGYTPRLFNCVIRTAFLEELRAEFLTYVGGASPDINFQARVSLVSEREYLVWDAPAICTNARHVTKSNGMLSSKIINNRDCEFRRLSNVRVYPENAPEFGIVFGCLGEMATIKGAPFLDREVSKRAFLEAMLQELSWPRSKESFRILRAFIVDYMFKLGVSDQLFSLIKSVKWTPSEKQMYPVDTSPSLSNIANLGLLKQIEVYRAS
jgi:glycosyltransferase involved in cell wall biosynthesis